MNQNNYDRCTSNKPDTQLICQCCFEEPAVIDLLCQSCYDTTLDDGTSIDNLFKEMNWD